jgi:DNA-directed RNA polymerase specialized sigma24 family protein
MAGPPTADKHSGQSPSIWLSDVDPEGRRLHPTIKELAYQKQLELARYRAGEMTDEAEVASLIEEAVYRTSKAAHDRTIDNPASYLFRTYTNLVDRTLRRTVKQFGMEAQILSQVAHSPHPEQALVKRLTRERVVESMDEKSRALWERHLLGYDLRELATEEGQSADYLGKRLRRAAERAIRLLLRKDAGDDSSISDNTVVHG